MNVNLAPLDYLREQHVRIAILSQTGISVKTFQSYLAWEEQAKQMGIQTSVDAIQDDNNARNLITASFMSTPGPTHMLLIDGGQVFLPWHVLALVSSKKHIITSYCPYHVTGMVQEDEIEEVSKVNGEFTMVSREALIHLQDHKQVVSMSDDAFLKSYYDSNVRDGVYHDEQWEFCERWHDIGGRVWHHKLVRPSSS